MTVDIHTHILPQIDDGAKNVQESVKILLALKKQGITHVCFTPHYDPRSCSMEEFVQKRQEAYEKIKDVCDEVGIKGYLAAEVKLYRSIFNYSDISPLCVEGTNYLLTEMPFENYGEDFIFDMLYKVQSDYSVIPVIVHPERYKKLYNAKFLSKVCGADCLVQADISALDGFFAKKKTVKFIDRGLVHFIASDCHNTSSRAPKFPKAKRVLGAKRFLKLMGESGKIISCKN